MIKLANPYTEKHQSLSTRTVDEGVLKQALSDPPSGSTS